MIEFTFDPPTLTVEAGTTVTWTYDESATNPVPNCESPVFRLVPPLSCPGHSTTSSTAGSDGKPLWDSGLHRAEGFPFAYTFSTPGTYPYYCVVHGGDNPNNPITMMNGTIVVTAAAPPEAPVVAPGVPAAPASPGPAPGAGSPPTLADSGGASGIAAALSTLALGLAVWHLRRRGGSV